MTDPVEVAGNLAHPETADTNVLQAGFSTPDVRPEPRPSPCGPIRDDAAKR
jgi:hypothetical protein